MQNVLILKIYLERDFAAGVNLPEAQNPIIPLTHCIRVYRAGIFEESMGTRNRGGIGLSYRPARLHRLFGIHSLESIPRLHKRLKIRAQYTYTHREGREI
jgi:hypothetical protein